MSVHVDDVFVSGSPEPLEKIQELIKLTFNIQDSGKVKKFLGVYYKLGHCDKGLYAQITMEKDVNKLVGGYDKFTGSDIKFHKTPGAPSTNLGESKLK